MWFQAGQKESASKAYYQLISFSDNFEDSTKILIFVFVFISSTWFHSKFRTTLT